MVEVSRLAVSVSPVPVLSVEFTRRNELFVWRVELVESMPVEETVLELKRRFPKYLSAVSTGQLARLVRFATKFNSRKRISSQERAKAVAQKDVCLNGSTDEELKQAKEVMSRSFSKSQILKNSPNFVYDHQVDFRRPAGPVKSFSDDDSD